MVPDGGNAVALDAVARVFELREFFEWRGLGSIDHSGVRVRDAYAKYDAERRFSVPALKIADPKSCQCGEVLKGVIKPWECKVFGTACTPETPLGALMVSSEGACAAYYQFGDVEKIHHAQRPKASPRRLAGEARDQRQRSRPARGGRKPRGKVTGSTITLAHGGGGKAMHDLIDDVFVRVFDNEGLAPLEDQARLRPREPACAWRPAGPDHQLLRGHPLFFPGGDIGILAVCGTVNDLAVGGAVPLYLTCSVIIEEGLDVETLRQVAASMAAHRRGGRRDQSSPATPRSSSVDACDKLFINTTGVGVIREGLELGVDRARPGDADPGERPARRSWRRHPQRARRHGSRHPDRERLRSLARLIAALLACRARNALHPRCDPAAELQRC